MKMYLANVTKQRHVFCYRMDHSEPEKRKLIELVIEPGHQIMIDEPQAKIESIISHYRNYGLIEVKEATRAQRFSGLMFQFTEINLDRLNEAVERRKDHEDERSNELRKVGILGDQQAADQIARKVGIPEVRVTSEIEEKQTQADQARGSRLVRQKLTVAEDGERRRANA